MSGESVDVNRTFHFEAVRKSNQVPKRRAMDMEFHEDDNIDEEVRYLGRLSAYKERKREISMVSDDRQEDKDYVQEEEPTSVDEPRYTIKKLGFVGGRNESTTITHNQALQTAKDDFLVPGTSLLEFSNEQKTKRSEVEQQLKKAEAAQRRRIQSKKAARRLGLRQSEKYAAWIMKERRKKRLKKRHDEVVLAKAAKMDRLDQILLDGSLVRLELWLIFSDDIGLPHTFNSVSCSYPPPHEKCAGPNCTNAYKYRDSSIVTTQYMKRCNL